MLPTKSETTVGQFVISTVALLERENRNLEMWAGVAGET